jgi:L-lysine exporter family protein LysE/ArgO
MFISIRSCCLGVLPAVFRCRISIGFAGGAMAASVVWFFSLGYGARLLAPVIARPVAWRVLDSLIAAVMFGLSVTIGRDAWRIAAAGP